MDLHVAGVLCRRVHLVAALGAAEPGHGVRVGVLRVVQRVLRLVLAAVALELAVRRPNLEVHLGHRGDVRDVHLQVEEVLADEVELLGAVAALRQGPPLGRLQRRVDGLELARSDGVGGGGHLGRVHPGSRLLLLLLPRMDLMMMVNLKHFVNTVAIKAPLTQVLKHDVFT